jgi:hypothetical protein
VNGIIGFICAMIILAHSMADGVRSADTPSDTLPYSSGSEQFISATSNFIVPSRNRIGTCPKNRGVVVA